MIEQITGWLEWSNLYLQLPLGVLGFSIALWQITDAKTAARNAQTAAELAKTAADNAITNFKSRSISSLIPQLMQLEDMIAKAVEKRSPEFLMHALHTWSWQAAMCRELLDDEQPAEQAIMQNIQRSTVSAASLKKQLINIEENADWSAKTSRLRGAVSDVNSGLQALSAALVVKEPK